MRPSTAPADPATQEAKRQFLSFRLGDQAYAIGIEHVREITGMQRFTPVPDVPTFVRGVINLRGTIVPIIEVRQRLGLPPFEYTNRSCIVVVDLEGASVGLLVDSVQEVANIPQRQIDPPPRFDTSPTAKFLEGIGKVGEDMRFILHIQAIARH